MEKKNEAAVTSCVQDVSQIRPWIRLWARMTDMVLFELFLIFGLLLLFSRTQLQNFAMHIAFTSFILWVFVEALLLSTAGTTPGKWYFRIQTILPSDHQSKFSVALRRSFLVFFRGFALNLPIISLFALARAHKILKRDGSTTWDRDIGSKVIHSRIGVGRSLVALFVFLLLIFFLAVVQTPNNGGTQQQTQQTQQIQQMLHDALSDAFVTPVHPVNGATGQNPVSNQQTIRPRRR